jgi:pimeloyl-ACP methyl ester carboxylesterase
MGSLVALEAAARAPQRATALLIVGTADPMNVSPGQRGVARDSPLEAIDQVNAFSHSSLAPKPSSPGPGVWLRGANRALMRRVQAGQSTLNLFHHDFTLCDRYEGGLAAAAQVRCPATLILGTRDQMTNPKQAGAIAQALKAQVRSLPAGHALMTEAPDGVLAALRAAIRISPGGPS